MKKGSKKTGEKIFKYTFYFGVSLIFLGLTLSIFETIKTNSPKELTTNLDLEHGVILGEYENGMDEYTIVPDKIKMVLMEMSDLAMIVPSLANPSVAYVRITPGMRKEQIAEIFEKKLSFDENDKKQFFETEIPSENLYGEGFFYPGVYLLKKESDGEFLGKLMSNRFDRDVVDRFSTSTKKIINLNTAVKIASLIEREAAGKNDMRLVSGVIWNRIFKGMSLDIDATLQYAKGSEENGWWPKVESADKYIDSPYNTYMTKGLPPTAISNPSLASIEAALNPKKTEYLFYIHDKNGIFRGAKTYKDHQKNIKKYYGTK